MKTLHAFWHWFENEKPTPREALDAVTGNLSDVALEALEDACDYVCVRTGNDGVTAEDNGQWALEHQPVAARKLSLSLCRALEETFEATCLDNPHVKGREYLDRKLKENGWSEDNATFRREYLGQWVIDLSAIVYPFVANRNGFQGHDLPQDRGRHRSVIAIDLGWHDDTAIVVSTSHRGHPDVWFRSAWKQPNLLPGRIAVEIERRRQPLLAAGDSVEVVVDTAGGSKIVAEELKERYGIPFKAAEKRDKKIGIELFRGGILEGTVHVDPYECGPMLSEWSALPYSDDRNDHHDQYPNHCADAGLYGYRQHRLPYRPELEEPKPGTEEWHQAARAKERLAAQKRARSRGGSQL